MTACWTWLTLITLITFITFITFAPFVSFVPFISLITLNTLIPLVALVPLLTLLALLPRQNTSVPYIKVATCSCQLFVDLIILALHAIQVRTLAVLVDLADPEVAEQVAYSTAYNNWHQPLHLQQLQLRFQQLWMRYPDLLYHKQMIRRPLHRRILHNCDRSEKLTTITSRRREL